MEPVNPYETPAVETLQHESELKAASKEGKSGDRRFMVLWPMLFSVNLIVPLLFAMQVTRYSGRIGMVLAAGLLFLGGWFVGRQSQANGNRLLTGALCIAITQLMPIIQLLAGLFGFEIAQRIGGVAFPDDQDSIGEITTEFGGFLCTLITGGLLITAAFVTGSLLMLIGNLIFKRRSSSG